MDFRQVFAIAARADRIANHGFPYLSGAGRLVIKDAIMIGAALVTMADSARIYLAASGARERSQPSYTSGARVRADRVIRAPHA